jgi:septal ring factor EnvC (AmiA/AmiB activator)
MSDLTAWGLSALAGATALHSVPHIVKAWRKRSEAESDLIVEALAELKQLRVWRVEAEGKFGRLEAALAEEKAARSHSDGQVAVLQMQLDRTHVEQELWEKRARALWEQVDDLYRCVASSEQGRSLPPPPGKDWL